MPIADIRLIAAGVARICCSRTDPTSGRFMKKTNMLYVVSPESG
ncbi:hypothetical protein [Allochromatium vinosum]|nr:hypothetical protein [Allochromatium vinosum]